MGTASWIQDTRYYILYIKFGFFYFGCSLFVNDPFRSLFFSHLQKKIFRSFQICRSFSIYFVHFLPERSFSKYVCPGATRSQIRSSKIKAVEAKRSQRSSSKFKTRGVARSQSRKIKTGEATRGHKHLLIKCCLKTNS